MSIRSTERLKLVKAYGGLYRRHFACDASVCFYCGATRDCLDHRPPLATLDTFSVAELRSARIPLVLVPSCQECNARLGAKPLLTVREAADHLLRFYDALYEKKFNLWQEDEIKEMSPMFQAMIKARQLALSDLNRKVRHLQELVMCDHLFPEYECTEEDEEL